MSDPSDPLEVAMTVLGELAEQVDCDCPVECRSKHLNASLREALEIVTTYRESSNERLVN
jgi:hypothetical protein